MRRPLLTLLIYMLAAAWLSSAQAAGTECKFQASGLSLNFGTLQPENARNVTVSSVAASLNADRAGDCAGVSFVIDADQGMHFNASRRMRSAAGGYIPYTLTNVPTTPQPGPGNGVYLRFTLNATVRGADYATARAGTYTDSLILTITP